MKHSVSFTEECEGLLTTKTDIESYVHRLIWNRKTNEFSGASWSEILGSWKQRRRQVRYDWIVLSCKSIENARDKRNVLTKMGLTFFRVELDSPRERILAPKDIISSQSYEPREKRLSSVLSTWIWSTIKPAISDGPTGHAKSNCRNSLLCNSRFFTVIPIASFCITLKDLWS